MEDLLSIKNFIFDEFDVSKTGNNYLVYLVYQDFRYYLNIENADNLIDGIISKLRQNVEERYVGLREKIIDYLSKVPRKYFDKWVFDKLNIKIHEKPSDVEDETYEHYVIEVEAEINGLEYSKMFLVEEDNTNNNIFDLFISEMREITENVVFSLKYQGLKTFGYWEIEYNNETIYYNFYYGENYKITGTIKKLNEEDIQYNILEKCNKVLKEVF